MVLFDNLKSMVWRYKNASLNKMHRRGDLGIIGFNICGFYYFLVTLEIHGI